MKLKQLQTKTQGSYVEPACDVIPLGTQGFICQSDPILKLSLDLERDGYGDVIEL